MSHLSDDEDEAPSPKKEPAPETKTKKKKKKKEKEPKNKEEFIVKLKNIPPNSNRVSHVIAEANSQVISLTIMILVHYMIEKYTNVI